MQRNTNEREDWRLRGEAASSDRQSARAASTFDSISRLKLALRSPSSILLYSNTGLLRSSGVSVALRECEKKERNWKSRASSQLNPCCPPNTHNLVGLRRQPALPESPRGFRSVNVRNGDGDDLGKSSSRLEGGSRNRQMSRRGE